MDHWLYRIQCNDIPRKHLVVHNCLEPYHHPFNTDVYGPDYNVRGLVTDKLEPKSQELGAETTEDDCSGSPEVSEQREMLQE